MQTFLGISVVVREFLEFFGISDNLIFLFPCWYFITFDSFFAFHPDHKRILCCFCLRWNTLKINSLFCKTWLTITSVHIKSYILATGEFSSSYLFCDIFKVTTYNPFLDFLLAQKKRIYEDLFCFVYCLRHKVPCTY